MTNEEFIERLRAQLERMGLSQAAEVEEGDRQSKIMLDSYADENQRISDERDRLRAEVAALRADAERYRWIRDGSNPPWVMQMLERYADNGSDFDAEVDAEVDAARAVQGDKT